jgi:hypothetical protein
LSDICIISMLYNFIRIKFLIEVFVLMNLEISNQSATKLLEFYAIL